MTRVVTIHLDSSVRMAVGMTATKAPVVRKDWLDECGLEVPKTISEFENVSVYLNEKYGATFDSASTRINDMGICGAFGSIRRFLG